MSTPREQAVKERQRLTDDILAWQAPEGRMDPQMSDTPLDTARAKLEAIHKMADAGSVWGEAHTRVEIRRLARTALVLLDEHAAASARREGETHDFKCYRCDKPLIANQTMEMCPACYEAVDLEPPKPPSADAVKDMRVEQNAFVDREIENSMRPRPSADARAKLEQAHARWKAAKEADYAEPTVRTRLALEAAEHNLFHLALPPHEGETPQPEGINADGASNSAPNLRTPQSDPRLSISQQTQAKAIADHYGVWEREKHELVILNALRALAPRAAPPETPQPAAEPPAEGKAR